ncbi:MAG: hypothetical protein JXA42_13120 [Anaerolineales bacterium]|nr:hypothetical protein [Anaerolineales bacterium]
MDKGIAEIQETIRQILTGMGIRKVVSIDDFYSVDDRHYQDAVALFQVARLKPEGEYSQQIPRDVLDAKENIWTRRLETFWSQAAPDIRLAILSELAETTGYEDSPGDVRDLSLLRTLIPEDIFVAIGPDAWDRDREGILTEAYGDHGILCLFDHDLRLAGLSESAGMTLLQQTLGRRGKGRVICALLTQKIPKDAELPRARAFASEMNLNLDQFLLLSKDRLRGDPMEFADGLKMAVLNYAREQLSRQVRDVAEQADKVAQQLMNDISVEDFEHIVIRSSEEEGIWEPDTLFRLFDIFRHNAFKTTALGQKSRVALYDDIERMRAIRGIKTSVSQPDCPSEQVHQIRHAELFDTAELLNLAHQPLDLGDIFQVGVGKNYILLAQPCDLMIRSKPSMGKRSIGIATLVQIQMYPATTRDPKEISSFWLDYFEERPGEKAFVKFRKSFQISLDVLDLAVFNDDGQCRITLSDTEVERFSTLHLPWRKRFEVLRRHYQGTHEEYQRLPYKQASSYQKKALKHLLLCSDKNIELVYDANGTFEFNVRRVGRYRAPLSIQLLSAYFSFLSRNPQIHDFARRDHD